MEQDKGASANADRAASLTASAVPASQSGIPSAQHTPGPIDRLERATWDSRVMASKSDIGDLIESHAYLLAAMADIASSARGSGPYARDRDADTLAMVERVASAAVAKATGGAA